MGGVRVFIGLGSNLKEPEQQVREGLAALDTIEQTSLLTESSAYRTSPLGPEQPDYVNAVAEIKTRLSPHALLDALLGIERRQGRIRGGDRWGPRIIDLDLLVYGDEEISDARLTVPHAGIAERRFVLVPLAEIALELRIPGLPDIASMLESCPPADVHRLAP